MYLCIGGKTPLPESLLNKVASQQLPDNLVFSHEKHCNP